MSTIPLFILKCDGCGRLAKCDHPLRVSARETRFHVRDCLNWTSTSRGRERMIDLCPLCAAKIAQRDGLSTPGRRGSRVPAAPGFDLLEAQKQANADRARVDTPKSMRPIGPRTKEEINVPQPGEAGAPPPPSPSPGDLSDPAARPDPLAQHAPDCALNVTHSLTCSCGAIAPPRIGNPAPSVSDLIRRRALPNQERREQSYRPERCPVCRARKYLQPHTETCPLRERF